MKQKFTVDAAYYFTSWQLDPSKRIAMLEDEAHLVPRLHNIVLNALVLGTSRPIRLRTSQRLGFLAFRQTRRL